MKKTFLITVLGASVVLATAGVHAQTISSTPSTAPAAAVTPSAAATASAASSVDPALFNLHKQKQLDSINEHIAKMQKRQTCIQAAETEKALSSCSSVVGEGVQPAQAVKVVPAVPTAVPPASPTAPAPATATLPPSAAATLPVSTPGNAR